MKRTVEVVSYNPTWPRLFEIEASLIKEALGSNCLAVHHIGSTSIPGLSAKPIIDIVPVVKNIQEVDKSSEGMKKLGYDVKGEHGIAFRRFFQKGSNVRTHNVHVFEEGDPEISRYLKFRDWMRLHEDDALAYAKLKINLAEKFPNDILKYCFGKDAFVANIDAKNGYKGWRIVQALTDPEWESVHSLRKQYYLKSRADPFSSTLKLKDHIHLVFYKEAEIIGYIHLQLRSEESAILRMIVIDERYRNQGFGTQFLGLCERWILHQSIKRLQILSSVSTSKFYYDHGYIQMPFNDPEGHPTDSEDVGLGKILL